MENQIVCPNCKKTIPSNSIIEDAAKGVSVEKESPIGRFQPSLESRKPLARDSKPGCGLSPTAAISDSAIFHQQVDCIRKNGAGSLFIGLLAVKKSSLTNSKTK